jgi:hypothetical protein
MGKIMSDWRTKPRQGRSQFLPLLDDIKKRLECGENIKMIFESYNDLKMSYPQFTRYVRKYCADSIKFKTTPQETNQVEIQQHSTSNNSTETSRPKINNPADLKRSRNRRVDLEELQNIKNTEGENE